MNNYNKLKQKIVQKKIESGSSNFKNSYQVIGMSTFINT